MTADIRVTHQALKVLRLLLNDLRRGRSAAEISRETKIGSGTLYPLLARFEKVGWVTSEWEQIEPSEAGRPRRRFYSLSALGERTAVAALNELQIAPGELAWAR